MADVACTCLLSKEPMVGPHTEREHDRGSCGGVSRPEPCGGCYDCVIAQIAHADRLQAQRQSR